MTEAKYEILIPRVDNMGNELADLAPHAMQYITQALQVNTAHVEQNRRVFMNGKEEPFDALIFRSEDMPLSDSTAKQLAAYLGEVANQDIILVSKEGKNGIQSWPVKNSQYQHGVPADFTRGVH